MGARLACQGTTDHDPLPFKDSGEYMINPTCVLITGASGGIGAALARVYARPGVTLALTGRNVERLGKTAETAASAGAAVMARALDLHDEHAVAAWIAEVDAAQPLDLAIANAGITGGHRGAGAEENLAELREIMAINFIAACATAHAAMAPMRRRRRGQIALMSSLAGLRGLPYSPGYCASKAALIAYGDALRAMLRADGVGVSVILPGFVATPMSERVSGPKPLMMDADRAARIVAHGLARGRTRIAFPLRLYWLQQLSSLLPAAPVDLVLNRVRVTVANDH
ncbi:MAG TPA: SDR family NAD(P)-dependent oxidoreductase [Stellaceae bacterium]|jgi:short-subunit dehydrogenase|nr:SDR family NAD(P)-dependent oxidoreductase [Stellaceae bacterium]